MHRLLTTILLLLIIQVVLIIPASAQKVFREQFTVDLPPIIKVNGIGASRQEQMHGIPSNPYTDLSLLVADSMDGKTWKLTTRSPIGVSISYNSRGTIMAVFVSMKRVTDGYEIPSHQISIYPSKVIFDTGPHGGDKNRIFHFSPIVTVSKQTESGVYMGDIKFTIVGQ